MKNTYLEKLTRKIKDVPYDYDVALEGLGGWMVLFIIGRFLTMLSIISNAIKITDLLGIDKQIDVMLKFALAIAPIELILTILITYFIFKRNILFRKLFVIRIAISLVVTLGITIYGYVIFSVFDYHIITNLIGAAIWISYLYVSKRVKNTFIYPYCQFADTDANKAIEVEDI